MPLPAALLKRLAKRGLVNDAKDEEIIAEDYDVNYGNPENYNFGNPKKARDENVWATRLKRRFTQNINVGVKGCSNKYNVHHKCSLYCAEQFGDGIPEPTKSYKIRFQRLTDRYKVPKDWVTVYDPGCAAYYFWNKIDDMVSWLPPTHPKAHISKSAATLRQQIEVDDRMIDDDRHDEPSSIQVSQPDNQAITEEVPEKYRSSLPVIKKPKARDLEKVLKSKHDRRSRRNNRESDKLDPMDPSSYSSCPRGKWSSGLNAENEKTAVDPTAPGGAPFQQRPLPSPGDVMRANMKNKKRNSENENSDENDSKEQGLANDDSDMDDVNSD